MVEAFVHSTVKGPGRRVWIRGDDREPGQPLVVFLDAELYMERVGAVAVLDALQAQRLVPPAITVFVSSDSAVSRHTDYVCDDGYARFLAQDVVPFVRDRHQGIDVSTTVLVGLSLSGLAAAHAALTTNAFQVAMCQSPSFWWEHERLASTLPVPAAGAPRLWISVGDAETSSGIAHPPSGVFQGVSQLESCRRGAEALRRAGYTTEYRQFHGGHDALCWRDDLTWGLPWAMNPGQ